MQRWMERGVTTEILRGKEGRVWGATGLGVDGSKAEAEPMATGLGVNGSNTEAEPMATG